MQWSKSLFALSMAGMVCLGLAGLGTSPAQDEPAKEAVPPAAPAVENPADPAGEKPAEKPIVDAAGLVKLAKNHDVWLDPKRKAIIVDGEVCLREGQLEMFACPKGTKEHESVISLNCIPEQVHAGLLAVGAKQGTPVQFDPEYKPATGQIIDIFILWKDEKGGKHKARAQEWIKHAKTEKEMPFDFVFAGSGFWTDEMTGKRHYQANGGDFICVSNFPTAMLDLPVESSQANTALLFVAFTEHIPPRGTKIRMVLIPRAKEQKQPDKVGEKQPDDKPAAAPAEEPKKE